MEGRATTMEHVQQHNIVKNKASTKYVNNIDKLYRLASAGREFTFLLSFLF